MKRIILLLNLSLLMAAASRAQEDAARIDSLLTKSSDNAGFCGSITLGNQPAFEILPVFKDVFKAGEARIEFKRNKEQQVAEIWIFNKGEMAQVSKME